MANRGKPLDPALQARIRRLGQYEPIKRIARAIGLSRNTVRKYLRKPVVV